MHAEGEGLPPGSVASYVGMGSKTHRAQTPFGFWVRGLTSVGESLGLEGHWGLGVV